MADYTTTNNAQVMDTVNNQVKAGMNPKLKWFLIGGSVVAGLELLYEAGKAIYKWGSMKSEMAKLNKEAGFDVDPATAELVDDDDDDLFEDTQK